MQAYKIKVNMCLTEMIMRDVNAGYILRYTHANVASFFFIFVYAQNLNFDFNNKIHS